LFVCISFQIHQETVAREQQQQEPQPFSSDDNEDDEDDHDEDDDDEDDDDAVKNCATIRCGSTIYPTINPMTISRRDMMSFGGFFWFNLESGLSPFAILWHFRVAIGRPHSNNDNDNNN
jgi:hypothetical protein